MWREAQTRWPLLGVTVIHRFGRMMPGDNIVLVVTASAHRQAAFEAASFLMDYLKTQAPFWKLEERPDGQDWVAAKEADDDAAARWVKDKARRQSLPGLTRASASFEQDADRAIARRGYRACATPRATSAALPRCNRPSASW